MRTTATIIMMTMMMMTKGILLHHHGRLHHYHYYNDHHHDHHYHHHQHHHHPRYFHNQFNVPWSVSNTHVHVATMWYVNHALHVNSASWWGGTAQSFLLTVMKSLLRLPHLLPETINRWKQGEKWSTRRSRPTTSSSQYHVPKPKTVGCLTSQQHASVSKGRICSDNFTCCYTETEVADQIFHLTQSQYTDTGPTSPNTDPISPGAWQGCHWSASF